MTFMISAVLDVWNIEGSPLNVINCSVLYYICCFFLYFQWILSFLEMACQYVIISVKKTRTNNVIEHVTIRFSIGKTSTGGSLDPTFYPPQSRQWVALCDCDPRDPDPSFAEPWPAWPTTHDPWPSPRSWHMSRSRVFTNHDEFTTTAFSSLQ